MQQAKRGAWRFGCAGAMVAVVLTAGSAWAAFDLAQGKFRITGWAENLTSVRTVTGVNEAGELNNFRNTLNLEGDIKISDNVEAFVQGRGHYELMWQLDPRLDQRPRHEDSVPGGRPMEKDFDLREYVLSTRRGPFTLKLGRQQVVWGESDALRMADIINPLDLSWHLSLENWEDIRIPLHMFNLLYEPKSEHQFRTQLIWIPGDFRPTQFAPEGSPWAIPGLPNAIWDLQKDQLPDRYAVKNSEFGGRIQWTGWGWEFSLFDFYSRVDDAVFKVNLPRAIAGDPLPLDFKWPWVNVVGGTFNVFDSKLTKTVFRGETAYTFDQPYSTKDSLQILERDTVAFMLGFDRPTMITWLNPRKSFFFSGQWFHKTILDHDGRIAALDMGSDKHQDILTLLVNTSYWHDYLTPQLLLVYDLAENGFVQPLLKYEPNDLWTFSIGANVLYGNKHADSQGFFGLWKDNDEIFLRARLKF